MYRVDVSSAVPALEGGAGALPTSNDSGRSCGRADAVDAAARLGGSEDGV